MEFESYSKALLAEPFDELVVEGILDTYYHAGSPFVFRGNASAQAQFTRNVANEIATGLAFLAIHMTSSYVVPPISGFLLHQTKSSESRSISKTQTSTLQYFFQNYLIAGGSSWSVRKLSSTSASSSLSIC